MSGVVRTINILEVIAKKGSINLENLSKETDLPKATLLRFLSTLSSLGYVCRDDADHYSLTLKLFSMGSRALAHNDLISKARPFAKAKVIPLYCTAIGKIFLSQMSEDELDKYLKATSLKPYTSRTIKTPEALKEQLELIRRRGWSIDDQEHEDNIMCIAAPVYDYTGHVVAAMSVSWPLFRFNQAEFEKIVSEIKSATDQLSAIMGYEKETER